MTGFINGGRACCSTIRVQFYVTTCSKTICRSPKVFSLHDFRMPLQEYNGSRTTQMTDFINGGRACCSLFFRRSPIPRPSNGALLEIAGIIHKKRYTTKKNWEWIWTNLQVTVNYKEKIRETRRIKQMPLLLARAHTGSSAIYEIIHS